MKVIIINKGICSNSLVNYFFSIILIKESLIIVKLDKLESIWIFSDTSSLEIFINGILELDWE